MDHVPEYEMGVCGDGFLMTPHIFNQAQYTDEDLYYECNELYPHSDMVYRQHPMQLNQLKIDYSDVRSDPAAFILSCKRITSVSSQILLKAMLWNRTAIMKKDTLPFSFMCEKDYATEKKVSLQFLNYYLLCYLVPAGLMFDDDYWRWRFTSPCEHDIYEKHLTHHSEVLGIDLKELGSTEPELRFMSLLNSRNADPHLMQVLADGVSEEVDYSLASSKMQLESEVDGKLSQISLWSLNQKRDGVIHSRFHLQNHDDIRKITFFPLDDRAGFVRIEAVQYSTRSGRKESLPYNDGFQYFPKNQGEYVIPLPALDKQDLLIEVKWKFETIMSGISHSDGVRLTKDRPNLQSSSMTRVKSS